MKHDTLDEVKSTIRTALLMERDLLKASTNFGESTANMLAPESRGSIKAFEQVLAWLSDLE